MNFKVGDFINCDCKDDHTYLIKGHSEENGYPYYLLRDVHNKKDSAMLQEFVDDKYKKVDIGIIRRLILYFILR